MSLRLRSVVDATLFKPITVLRDAALLWLLGLSSTSDVFFANLATVLLGQSLAVGPLANAWIPGFMRLDLVNQRRQIGESFRREFWVAVIGGGGITLVVVAAVVITAGNLNPFVSESAIIIWLTPLAAFAYLLGWLGNYLLAQRDTRLAQLAWALPSILIVLISGGAKVMNLQAGACTLVGIIYAAFAASVLCGIWLVSRNWNTSLCVSEEPGASKPIGISPQVRSVTSFEVLAFAILTYALYLIPSAYGEGLTAVFVLVTRIYGALSVVVVSPLSQLILLGNAQNPGERRRVWELSKLVVGIAAAIPVLIYLLTRAIILYGINVSSAWLNVPFVSLVWIPVFIAMSFIQILTRRLGASGIVTRPSLMLACGYGIAGLALWLPDISPAIKFLIVYVFLGALVCALFYISKRVT